MDDYKKKDAVSTEGIEETLGRWREDVKNKKRGIFSFEDLAKIKLSELKQKIYSISYELPPWKIRECFYKNVGEYEFYDDDYREIATGGTWGEKGKSAFFKNTVTVPDDMDGRKVVLHLYFGGDSLITVNGKPYQGLDPFRNTVLLSEKAVAGEKYELEVESYYMWHAGESEIKTLECSMISAIDEEVEDIYWDYKAVFGGLAMPGADESVISSMKSVLKKAVEYIDFDEKDYSVFLAKLQKGRAVLRENVYGKGMLSPGRLSLIGNSHLDLVFLWDYAEFIRKSGRTHATMLRLMERYPEFIFTQSQPAMYEELRVHYPNIFEEIQQRVKEGRWEAIGAMWCEPDCNLISGESFVRQIIFGTHYYEKYFGVTPKTCWLPDVFGNSYGMPQILKKTGVEYFVTHKMNIWNDTNPWKDSAFWWEGPDGSRVFGVCPPTHFIGTMEADSLKAHWNRFTEREAVGESLYCYGWGDGGGGVDEEMLEYVKRYRNFPSLPESVPSKAEDALERMRDNALNGGEKCLTVWKDELYLEAHRGVGTTKALLKKLNRYCEFLYRNAEMYAVIAEAYGLAYPADALNSGWRKLLTAQFHDSLPGSHITSVFGDLLKEYDYVTTTGEKVLNDSLNVIAGHIGTEQLFGKPFAVFNPNAFTSSNVAVYSGGDEGVEYDIFDKDGHKIHSQSVTNGNITGTAFIAKEIPGAGYGIFYAVKKSSEGAAASTYTPEGAVTVENERYKLIFDETADITSIYDKVNMREVLREGTKANRFRLFEDRPGKYEAWDIVATYVDCEVKLEGGSIERITEGDTFTEIVIVKPILDSTLRQSIILYKDPSVSRIDFKTTVDWRERRKLLKVEFDVDVYAKGFTSDIAYATIERSNYRYNPYDAAKFEVSAHNFIDLSDGDYGVSLLNDCKYGHEVDGSRMIISLLKGPMNPDPESDIGTHEFTYSLYPHNDGFVRANTVSRGLELNNPFIIVPLPSQPNDSGITAPETFIKITGGKTGDNAQIENVTLEAFKKSEDGNGYIVRLCEKTGRRTDVTVEFFEPLTVKNVNECDMLERNEKEYAFCGNKFEVTLKPFEVGSFKVMF